MFGNVYGLDLGTYDIKVYDKKANTIWKEKNTVAVKEKKYIISVGDEAYEMYEKSPQNIEIEFPMKEGVISHFYDMQYLLQNLLKKERHFARGSKYVIAVPTDVTEVEKKAFYDLVIHSTAKAREVRIVERGIANGIGLGLDVEHAQGILIANFGGETTELSVLSYGGMVMNRMLKVGGNTFDQSIVNHIKHYKELLIGRPTAEFLRQSFGLYDETGQSVLTVSGRNLLQGIPQQREISVNLVRAAMKEPLESCIREMKVLLERTPPEVRHAIETNGIYITGGVANLAGMDRYIEGFTGLKVNKAKAPEYSVVEGLKKIIESKELRKLTYSMMNENDRWMK